MSEEGLKMSFLQDLYWPRTSKEQMRSESYVPVRVNERVGGSSELRRNGADSAK